MSLKKTLDEILSEIYYSGVLDNHAPTGVEPEHKADIKKLFKDLLGEDLDEFRYMDGKAVNKKLKEIRQRIEDL